ncbi:MAG TPA: sialate O-acetylesterase [Planctomycetaceae bacterium]|nr:sialate O-acetylesterase [Planctomycetaceae bacterium]
MMKRVSSVCILLTLYLALPASKSFAEISLPRIFADNMVLQRDIPIPVWGGAGKGEKITVAFDGNVASTTADANGRWMVRLPAMTAGNDNRELTVNGTDSPAVTIRNVVVGDVWLCSGQSNMEWVVGGCNTTDGTDADFPDIRFARVSKVMAPEPTEDVQLDRPWSTCQNGTPNGCTAVGFYFAVRLHKELGIPIGLIDDAWGGSAIDPWIPPNGFEAVKEMQERGKNAGRNLENYRKALPGYIDKIEAWVQDSRRRLSEDRAVQPLPGAPAVDNTSGMFNAMIAPLIPYGIRGMLWYQGESNAGEGAFYFFKQQALVEGWRGLWNQPGEARDFPFYFVQLANFLEANENPQGDPGGWPKIRDAQRKSLEIKNSGMAVTIDIGEAQDIHPRNKFDVGERLALWALAKDYGRKDLVFSGPLYKSMTVEGNAIRIAFDHTGSGLMVGRKEGRSPTVEVLNAVPCRFAISGADQKWIWAEAKIDGDTILVSAPEVAEPVAVRYAWSNNPEGANLYNREGLPASPFRTDDW